MYRSYIRHFVNAMGQHDYYSQHDVDEYFNMLMRDASYKETSKSAQRLRTTSLKLYLNEALDLNISFKSYATKGRTDVRPHHRIDVEKQQKMLSVAKEHSAEMYALACMMLETGARIQDLIGDLTFGHVFHAKKDGESRRIAFTAKKTVSREVYIT